jgi:hypothetical protein
VLFAATLALATPAQAAPGTRLRFVSGECQSLVIAGRAAGRGCKGELVNVVYTSGTISFVFTAATGRLISFFGRIGAKNGPQTTLKIGQVTTVDRATRRTLISPAVGSCVLTPFAANRSRLECSARAAAGTYSALFRTSGPIKDITL